MDDGTKLSEQARAKIAREHGLDSSPFVRLACNEFTRTHAWEDWQWQT